MPGLLTSKMLLPLRSCRQGIGTLTGLSVPAREEKLAGEQTCCCPLGAAGRGRAHYIACLSMPGDEYLPVSRPAAGQVQQAGDHVFHRRPQPHTCCCWCRGRRDMLLRTVDGSREECPLPSPGSPAGRATNNRSGAGSIPYNSNMQHSWPGHPAAGSRCAGCPSCAGRPWLMQSPPASA